MRRTHGLSDKLPEYFVWEAMRQRCLNPKHPNYPRYGGRGIKICERWSSFENFYADMGSRPSPQHQLDRRENNGDYTPGNCRWATRTEQQRNTRRSRMITHQGLTLTLPEWADRLGLDKNTLGSRFTRGMPPEMILHSGKLPPGAASRWRWQNG